jgi:shikimate dehydrogenase
MNNETRLYGVIGDPIRHTRSPLMQNCAFQVSGINAVYAAFHVKPEQLGDAMAGLRAFGIGGLNVTIPHKVEVMNHLDEIDESAQAIGAVNTIVNRDGRLIGYNTDGIGYVRSLKEEAEPQLAGKRIVVLGAGGASRGIVWALAREHPEAIWIANRTHEKAQALADSLGGFRRLADDGAADHPVGEKGTVIRAIAWEALREVCREADVVINTTSVGMAPDVDATPIDAAWLRPDAVASDLIYNPLKTRFLQEAEQRGCRIHGGLGMFVYQGAYAFEYWTGQPAPVKAMRDAVLASLSGK